MLRVQHFDPARTIASPVFVGVQALRGVAAILVVMDHILAMINGGPGGPGTDFGLGWLSAGVDIFFAISGFIMVMTTAPNWGQPGSWQKFLRRRFVRILPLYWLFTAVKVAATLALPGLALHPHFTSWYLIASFLLIPAWNIDHTSTHPILGVGWTLSFEMTFYMLFALGLALFNRPAKWIAAVLCLAVVAGMLRTDRWEATASILDPILLEFIFGMSIGLATLAGRRLRVAVAYAAIALAAILLGASTLYSSVPWNRVLSWGIPGALLLSATVALEQRWQRWPSRFPKLLGDASYAIYLTHSLSLPLLGAGMAKLDFLAGPARWSVEATLGIVGAVTVGLIAHLYIERPMLRFLSTSARTRAQQESA